MGSCKFIGVLPFDPVYHIIRTFFISLMEIYRKSFFMTGRWFGLRKAQDVSYLFRETEDKALMEKLLYTLFFGFFAGVLGMILKKESLLYGTGFLDSYTLSPVKYLEPDIRELMISILMQRLGVAALLVILSTTYLGSAAAYGYQIWSGLAMGILASGSIIRYGGKGILLLCGCLLPQQFIFLPAFLMLSVKCCGLCQIMYFQGISGGFSGKDKGRFFVKKGLHMMFSIALIAVGSFVEAYINPKILQFILRLF